MARKYPHFYTENNLKYWSYKVVNPVHVLDTTLGIGYNTIETNGGVRIGNNGFYISTQVKAEVRKKKVVRTALFVNEFT